MSSESPLEAEELENVPLVRMEDVQPDRSSEKVGLLYKKDIESDSCSQSSQDEAYVFVVNSSDLQCVVDDDDSNVGSMVSIQSEETICKEESELIVPEVLESVEVPTKNDVQRTTQTAVQFSLNRAPFKNKPPESWPTLEILPGGVINLAEKTDPSDNTLDREIPDVSEMMYACAKCSQRFQYLFCLVKHVRWHEDEAEREKLKEMESSGTYKTPIQNKIADLERRSKEMDKLIKKHKGEIKEDPKEKTVKQKIKEKYICLHAGKRIVVPKPKARRAPKKS